MSQPKRAAPSWPSETEGFGGHGFPVDSEARSARKKPVDFPPSPKLDGCWVGSLDFNFLGNTGIFHSTPKQLSTFCRGVVAAAKKKDTCSWRSAKIFGARRLGEGRGVQAHTLVGFSSPNQGVGCQTAQGGEAQIYRIVNFKRNQRTPKPFFGTQKLCHGCGGSPKCGSAEAPSHFHVGVRFHSVRNAGLCGTTGTTGNHAAGLLRKVAGKPGGSWQSVAVFFN